MSDRLPWSKFNWADWETDPALSLVSMGAQGFWMRLLCIAVKEGGYVLIGREIPSTDKLAHLMRSTPEQVEEWLAELTAENVFSRDRRGVIYSRRIVRDVKKYRTNQQNGKRGGNPSLRKTTTISPSDNPPSNPPLKADKNKKKNKNQKREESPNPLSGASASASFKSAMDAYPEAGRASTKPVEATAEWAAVCAVEGEGRLLAAVAAFAASDYAAEGRGRRVPSLQRWLREGKYIAWLPAAGAVRGWTGPPDVRAAVVAARNEDLARGYLDRCVWRDLPDRAIVTTSPTIAKTLEDEAGAALAELGVTVVLDRERAA